jgi:flagellar motor protein MotB
MRAQARQSSQEEEEESAFISMTDMTVGFLFIVMILLAFFASQFRMDNLDTVPKKRYEAEVIARVEAEQKRDALEVELQRVNKALTEQLAITSAQASKIVKLEAEIAALKERNIELDADLTRQKEINRAQREAIARLQLVLAALKRRLAELEASMRDPLETYLAQVAEARQKLLEQLRDNLRIDFPDLTVVLSEQSDALQFQGEGLFLEGKSTFVSATKRDIVRQIAVRLNEVLPCYAFTTLPHPGVQCDNPNIAIIEAVQIEGHTDSSGPYAFNTNLSAARATTTFGLMMETVPGLRDFKNARDQAVMSFAGYGPDRPITSNETLEGRATNRRIDLRLIMVTPSSTDEIATIRARFTDLSRGSP